MYWTRFLLLIAAASQSLALPTAVLDDVAILERDNGERSARIIERGAVLPGVISRQESCPLFPANLAAESLGRVYIQNIIDSASKDVFKVTPYHANEGWFVTIDATSVKRDGHITLYVNSKYAGGTLAVANFANLHDGSSRDTDRISVEAGEHQYCRHLPTRMGYWYLIGFT